MNVLLDPAQKFEECVNVARVRLQQSADNLFDQCGKGKKDSMVGLSEMLYLQELTPATTIDTCAVDGKKFFYNPEFVVKTYDENPKHLVFVVAHEMLHIYLRHPLRINGRDIRIYNLACDYVINSMLKAMEFDMPPKEWGICLDSKYDELDEDQIYNILEKKEEEEEGEGEGGEQGDDEDDDSRINVNPNDSGDDDTDGDGDGDGSQSPEDNIPDDYKDDGKCGGVIEPPTTGDPEQDKQVIEEIEERIDQATSRAARHGTLPANVLQDIVGAVKKELPLEDMLIEWATNKIRTGDKSYRRQHRNYQDSDIIMPINESDELDTVAFAIDTSGSTRSYLPDMKKVVESFRDHFNCKTYVIYCDVNAHTDIYEEGDEIEFDPVGGGGTRFEPVFAEVQNNDEIDDPDVLIFLTDMQGTCDLRNWTDGEPTYPVLWIDCEYNGSPPDYYTPPFGDVIPFD